MVLANLASKRFRRRNETTQCTNVALLLLMPAPRRLLAMPERSRAAPAANPRGNPVPPPIVK
jgi:hypothetical protein